MAKRIYLVKKDIERDDQDNWIIMNGHKFLKFTKTEDGKRRKDHFARVDACSENDSIIYMEVMEDKLADIKSITNHSDYLKTCAENSKYEILSYDLVFDTDSPSIENILSNAAFDLEETVYDRVYMEAIWKLVDTWSYKEKFVFSSLYLRNEPLRIKEIAKQLGISSQSVEYWKNKAVAKYCEYQKKQKNISDSV